MADEPHEVVKLLLARMESHPEEFRIGDGVFHLRWSRQIDMIHDHGREADKAALNAKLRDIIMDEVHEQVMDELCNGPERRRKEAEENDYERNLSKSLALTQRQMSQQVQQNLNTAFANAYDVDCDRQLVGVGIQSPTTKLDVLNTGNMAGTQGSQVLGASRFEKMKRMMLGGSK